MYANLISIVIESIRLTLSSQIKYLTIELLFELYPIKELPFPVVINY